MTQFVAVIATTGYIDHVCGRPDPVGFDGVPDLRPMPRDGLVYYPWQERITFSSAPSDTCVLTWVDNAPTWVETAPLAVAIERAVGQIDAAANALRMHVISQQTNMPEYERAERHAREYKAAGYPADDVPRGVAGWVAAKHRESWTARQATDNIIATADAWIELLDDIRDLRLLAKEDVRHATDCEEVAARVQQFSTDLTNLMEGVS